MHGRRSYTNQYIMVFQASHQACHVLQPHYVPIFKADINTSNYAQIDFILITADGNAITNITNFQVDSDHSSQFSTPNIKLAKTRQPRFQNHTRYRTHSENELEAYNFEVKQRLQEQHAAEHMLTKVHPAQEKDYISAQPWKYIEEKQQALENREYDGSQTLP